LGRMGTGGGGKGIVFDVKRFALHDGPGTRTTVFFKGCPMACRWCHNPESQDRRPQLAYSRSRCSKDCHRCVAVCPEGALVADGPRIRIRRVLCTLCRECLHVCPSEALEVIGREMSVEELIAEVERDVVFFDESGGGMTVSGGEPLSQPEFLDSLLTACRKNGVHTALDTCGYAPFSVLRKAASKVDLILFDVKIVDDRAHRLFTGVSNRLILENLRALSALTDNIVIRIPLIPGMTDSPLQLKETAEFALSLRRVRRIGLLNFHRGGRKKYAKIGRVDSMPDARPLPDERLESIRRELAAYGFGVQIGGSS
jgi:pyruvate formate lyase activating enzyme